MKRTIIDRIVLHPKNQRLMLQLLDEIDERGGEEQLNTPITVEITRWCPENKAWYVREGMIVRGRVIG